MADIGTSLLSTLPAVLVVPAVRQRFRTIQRRTYHSDRGNAFYWGSNDEAQGESMDIIANSYIQKALDISCGTGIDFSAEFPSCEIPPNLNEIDDCTQEWTFTLDLYNYVHIRYLVDTILNWTELFKQAYKTLRSSSYLESFEASPTIKSNNNTVTPESAVGQWDQIFIEGSKTTSRTFTVIANNLQRKAMEEAGFVDIEKWNFKCPLSPWPKDPKLKEMGQFGQLFATQDTAGLLTFVASILGWSHERFYMYISQFRREIRDRRNHSYFCIRVLWGRKP
ncbi:hypothetical protein EDB81DRAFT_845500 [Dactylonectria macrodidyma]|uniref:Methyltransferase n=1 Tax=Dactylonectria macrodidyma TaxID=307937 RepID=A0A9P9E6X3_9HYPO|nr:hypothetical protein EDB81DRAFT_845500 [Dactylonectria macrodidyma]